MKKFLSILTAAVALSAAAHAQTPFTVNGSGTGTLSTAIVPAGDLQKVQVQYINATSDQATSALSFESPVAEATITASGTAGSTIISCLLPGTSGSGTEIVILGAGERAIITGTGALDSNGNPTITLANPTINPVNVGDKVYQMNVNGTIGVGAATLSLAAPTIFASPYGPALIELTGTARCHINIVAGVK
jgi:hypothetical protein